MKPEPKFLYIVYNFYAEEKGKGVGAGLIRRAWRQRQRIWLDSWLSGQVRRGNGF